MSSVTTDETRQLPSDSDRVCPRCGVPATGEAWCTGCGLNLKAQGELPTAEAYAANKREEHWLEEHESATQTLEQPKTGGDVDLSALPPPTGAPTEAAARPPTGPPGATGAEPGPGRQSPGIRIGLVAVAVLGVLAIALTAWSLTGLSVPALGHSPLWSSSHSSESAATTPISAPVPKPARSPVPVPTPKPSPTEQAKRTINQVVVGQWRAIESGDYQRAWSYLSPQLQAAVGPESAWVASHKSDVLLHVDVKVDVTNITHDTATANIATLQTRAIDSGCKDWSGHYGMVRSGNTWLIDQAILTPTSC